MALDSSFDQQYSIFERLSLFFFVFFNLLLFQLLICLVCKNLQIFQNFFIFYRKSIPFCPAFSLFISLFHYFLIAYIFSLRIRTEQISTIFYFILILFSNTSFCKGFSLFRFCIYLFILLSRILLCISFTNSVRNSQKSFLFLSASQWWSTFERLSLYISRCLFILLS